MKGFLKKKVREFLFATSYHGSKSAEHWKASGFMRRDGNQRATFGPHWLLCGNSALPSVRPLMALLPCPAMLFVWTRPPKVNHLQPPATSSHFPTYTLAHRANPTLFAVRWVNASAGRMQLFLRAWLCAAWLDCWIEGAAESTAFTRQNGLFKKNKEEEEERGWTHTQNQMCQLLWTQSACLIVTIISLWTLLQPVLSCTYLIQIPGDSWNLEDK